MTEIPGLGRISSGTGPKERPYSERATNSLRADLRRNDRGRLTTDAMRAEADKIRAELLRRGE